MSDRHTLEAVLDWVPEVGGSPVTTLARFAIALDNLPIWPAWGDDNTDLEVFIDDLLVFLVDNWDSLLLQQVYPHGLAPHRPSDLMTSAEEAASSGPRRVASESMMAEVLAFTRAHDLSQCFGGLYELPSLWLVRQGADMLIETSRRLVRVPVEEWIRFASDLGDEIARRLAETDTNRWRTLIADWHARDCRDPVRIASLAIGHTVEVSQRLLDENLIPRTASVTEAANDNSSLRIAARMVGAIPYAAIRSVLTAAKNVSHRPSKTLDEMRERLQDEMIQLSQDAYPHEQGVYAARWLRQTCSLDAEARARPRELLKKLGVQLITQPIGPATVDAIAIWGDAHGPGVIFNAQSKRLSDHRGGMRQHTLRISAAHELCHLLLDYRRTLAAVDSLDDRMPVDAERRANAFAAEFLLPARTAVAIWRRSDLEQTWEGINSILDRLSSTYNVSRAVAGWQLDHGLEGSSPEIIFLLDELLGRR